MGYSAMLGEYFRQMNLPKQELLPSIVCWNTVQNLTIAIDDLACHGGGEKSL